MFSLIDRLRLWIACLPTAAAPGLSPFAAAYRRPFGRDPQNERPASPRGSASPAPGTTVKAGTFDARSAAKQHRGARPPSAAA